MLPRAFLIYAILGQLLLGIYVGSHYYMYQALKNLVIRTTYLYKASGYEHV